MGALGIGDGDMVVVYDGSGHVFRARASGGRCRAMGHDKVEVLDGGLPKWKREGRAVESGPAAPRPRKFFTARPEPALVRDFDAVMGIVKDKSAQMVDARSASRFTGEEAGTARRRARPAICPAPSMCHYRSVLTADGTLESRRTSCAPLFAEKGVDLRAPIVTTCGSGVTAAILMLALDEIGARRRRAL